MVHESVGYDGGKKIKGRKRFILVDTLGLVMQLPLSQLAFPSAKARSNCWPKSNKSVSACLGWCVSGWMGAFPEKTFCTG